MAAAVFAEHARRAGLAESVHITSCGIGPWHVGEPADRRAAKTLADHGYPTEHVAAQLGPEHRDADLLVAMDSGHYEVLLRDVDSGRVRMLRSFDPDAPPDAEVPDPYYGGASGFTDVLDMIEAAMPGLLDWTRERSR